MKDCNGIADITRTVNKLIEIYKEAFGGKEKGRYQISRENLKWLHGAQRLHATTIEKLKNEIFENGFILIDLDDVFCLVRCKLLRGWRKVPARVIDCKKPKKTSNSDNDESEWDD